MRFTTMRGIVIIGYLLGILLFFLPVFDGHSQVEIARFNLNHGDAASGLFDLLTFAARIGFFILVLWRPDRWVFVAGGVWAAFVMLYNLIIGPLSLDTADGLIPFLSLSMRMAGLFALNNGFRRSLEM